MNMKYTAEDLKSLQALPLDIKVGRTLAKIMEYMKIPYQPVPDMFLEMERKESRRRESEPVGTREGDCPRTVKDTQKR